MSGSSLTAEGFSHESPPKFSPDRSRLLDVSELAILFAVHSTEPPCPTGDTENKGVGNAESYICCVDPKDPLADPNVAY